MVITMSALLVVAFSLLWSTENNLVTLAHYNNSLIFILLIDGIFYLTIEFHSFLSLSFYAQTKKNVPETTFLTFWDSSVPKENLKIPQFFHSNE